MLLVCFIRTVKFVHRKYQKKTMYCLLMRQFAKSYLPRKPLTCLDLSCKKRIWKKLCHFLHFFKMNNVNKISNLCYNTQRLEIRLKETKVELELLRNTVLERQAINVKIGDIVFVRKYITAYSGNKNSGRKGIKLKLFVSPKQTNLLSFPMKERIFSTH